MNYHFFTIEKIYHFRCYECDRWWSIADWSYVENIVCPHCGRVAIVADKSDYCVESNAVLSVKPGTDA